MSALCQKRTSTDLFNYLIGAAKQRKHALRTDTCSDVIDKTARLDALADKKNFLVVTN